MTRKITCFAAGVLIPPLVIWLSWGFIALSLDPHAWSEFGRVSAVLAVFCGWPIMLPISAMAADA